MNTNSQIIAKIAQIILSSELSLLESQKASFSAYISTFADYKTLSKIERKAVVEAILKENTGISARTVQNNFAKMVTADTNGLDLSKYGSFVQIESANKKIKEGVSVVLKSGANKGTAKFSAVADAKIRDAKTVVVSAKNEAIELIAADAKIIELIAYCKAQGYDLNHVRLAIK